MFNKQAKEPLCPLIKKPCIKEGCLFWVHIRGQHPQTGEDMDMPDCAVRWLPVLLIENAKETRQGAAAVESLRNESVTSSQQVAAAIDALANQNSLLHLKS